MRWLLRFRHLWRVEAAQPPSFEADEQRAKTGLEHAYRDQKQEDLDTSIEVLSEDTDEPREEEQGSPAPAYDVGEVDSEDLLSEDADESHYSMDVVEARIEGADEHLLEAEHIEPE